MTNEQQPKRITKVAKECNVATKTIIDFLNENNMHEKPTPNTKISHDIYEQLLQEFQPDKLRKEQSQDVVLPGTKKSKPAEKEPAEEKPAEKEGKKEDSSPKKEEDEVKDSQKDTEETEKTEEDKSSGLKVVDKIDLEERDPKTGRKKKVKAKKKDTEEKPDEEKSVEEDKPEEPLEENQETEEKTEPQEEETPEVKEEESVPEAEEKEAKTEEIPEEKPEEIPEEKEEKQTETEEKEEKEEKDVKEESKEEPKEEKIEASSEEKKSDEKEEKEETEEKPAAETETKKEDKKDDGREEKKGLTILGKIDVDQFNKDKKKKPVASTSDPNSFKKKRRKRKKITKDSEAEKDQKDTKSTEDKKDKKTTTTTEAKKTTGKLKPTKSKKKKVQKEEINEKQIDEKIKQTLSRLEGGSKTSRSKLRKKKRDQHKEHSESDEELTNVLEVTEFITANELASLMEKGVTEIISSCMKLGLMVSINQRLDAETITLVADEFGYDVEFREAEVEEPELEEEDNPETLVTRAPIVTIMGHVDHGKTSLLDFIQKSKIIAGESGGITQHIGAYEVELDDGRKITYLDTPGHEAFTAMRARGAKVTDVAVIVIAADDAIKPQTKEAISHAQAAGVPIVIAINKVDKPEANPERVKEQLAEMNILVEDWGGKYQCQEISAKHGTNVDDLQEKILLEAEIQELKADPNKRATGTVVEATLDKGKGVVTSVLVQKGTLKKGDVVLAGAYEGKIKALFNERGQRVEEARPSTPVQVLGIVGAPQAGDKFYVMEDERKAKAIANKRQQLLREQGRRAKKHITLDEIGRRLAIGNFQELNVIIKGDYEGSIEALADSLQKLSTNEVQVNVIHKGVGQITESDVLLASASDAIIVGFQVRPSPQARKIAEQEQIDIRLHSIIYDAIEEVKSALEGMLSPKIEENIIGNAEVRDVFKITKVGTVAGCMVTDGKIKRNSKVRLIREGVVTYNGVIDTLKRFKENVKEVHTGYECGITITNYNDLKVGDELECFEEVEVKRTLEEDS